MRMDDFVAGMFVFFLGGLMLITLYALLKTVRRRFRVPSDMDIPGEAEERLMQRLDQLERRLSDTQEVMLSLDEKVTLSELPPPRDGSRTLLE